MKHLGSLESTQEARAEAQELLRIFRALQTFHMRHISMNTRWCMNQLLKNTKGEESEKILIWNLKPEEIFYHYKNHLGLFNILVSLIYNKHMP